jgi:hypothetical protein
MVGCRDGDKILSSEAVDVDKLCDYDWKQR